MLLKKLIFRHFMLHPVRLVEGAVPTRTRRLPTTVMLAQEAVEKDDFSSLYVGW
jgi:hypothetical protein